MLDNLEQLLTKKQQIKDLDLSMIADSLIYRQKWLPSEAAEGCEYYKNFLFLNYKYPEENIVPSTDIDEVWHTHILDTEKYKADCEVIFGNYLHHYPYFGRDEHSNMEDLVNAFKKTQELHEKEFGHSIPSVRYPKILSWLIRMLNVSEIGK